MSSVNRLLDKRVHNNEIHAWYCMKTREFLSVTLHRQLPFGYVGMVQTNVYIMPLQFKRNI